METGHRSGGARRITHKYILPCTRPPLQRAKVKGLTPERVLLLHAQTAASLRGQKVYKQGKGIHAEEHQGAVWEGRVQGGQAAYEQGKGIHAEASALHHSRQAVQ